MMMNGKYLIGALAGLAVGALIMLFAGPWAASAQGAKENASNTLVTCEPSQQVVVRHTVVNGELQVATQCVGATTARSAGYVDDGGLIQAVRPVARPVSATRTAYAPAPVRRVATTQEEPKRSWKKTALVIGGSAGAGAGVGAIAGGKKGALIGAAIGGGAASIYEAIKR